MTERTSTLSQDAFERLIARAVEMESAGSGRIDLERARAIALELGISAEAWEAALSERPLLERSFPVRKAAGLHNRRPLAVAVTGVVAGALAGLSAGLLGDAALVLGGLAVAAGAALVVDGMRRRSWSSAHLDLAAWWLALPVGIALGMGELHADPIAFGVGSWMGCAALSVALRWRSRKSAGTMTSAPNTA